MLDLFEKPAKNMNTKLDILTFNFQESLEYSKTLAYGSIYNSPEIDCESVYYTEGVGRNKGKGYCHIDKLKCLDEEGQEHRISFVFCTDGRVKFDDFGITAAQRKKNDLAAYEAYPLSLRTVIDKLFPNIYILNKTTIAKYMIDKKMNLSIQTVLGNIKNILLQNEELASKLAANTLTYLDMANELVRLCTTEKPS